MVERRLWPVTVEAVQRHQSGRGEDQQEAPKDHRYMLGGDEGIEAWDGG